ncbi:MAG TPA: RNA polymerase sigma factor [Gemmatimonadaceae bacterium]|jgi:RNA polymerase sigma-70 factor (ECF subfamily)
MTGLSVHLSDAPDLITRTRDGDERAFASLVEAYQPRVFRWAFALSGDRDDAEDIAQEVFVRVYRKLAGFRGDGPFDAWLYRITRRVAMRRVRSSRARVGLENDVYTTDPGARVDRQRAFTVIQSIATTLPMRQREVFVLCDLEGRTPTEVAAMLDMKDVSVRASLFKARAAVRRNILATHPCFREDLP